MNLVGHNDLPQPPSERRQEEFDELDNPERLSPADPVRQSQQEYYKQWLENLFSVTRTAAMTTASCRTRTCDLRM